MSMLDFARQNLKDKGFQNYHNHEEYEDYDCYPSHNDWIQITLCTDDQTYYALYKAFPDDDTDNTEDSGTIASGPVADLTSEKIESIVAGFSRDLIFKDKPMKRETNEDLVVRLMNFSPFGALCQVFILQALEQYSKSVMEADPAELESPMISGQAWAGQARHIHAEIEKHFARS